MIQMAIFALGFAVIVAVSWYSLRRPNAYGFYRFFAFVGTLALVVLNAPLWFRDPFSAPRLLSWLMLLGSLVLAVHGFQLLQTVGRPEGHFENTTEVVRVGAYRYIRHPLYASLLLLGAGAFLKDVSLTGAIVLFMVVVSLIATARVEEQDNLTRFGNAYAQYMKTTKMFVPGVW
jgi:protein-S-isoprenylcysteine O-methyltransferase Ste14